MDEPPGGTWAICPVCFWEDAPEWVDDGPRRCGSNSVTLREAQRNFGSLGASEPVYVEAVRPPRPEEARDAGWEPEDVLAEREALATLAEIEQAFRGVTREGGVSLHETIALDNYEGAEERARMRAMDRDRRWEDLQDEDLAEVAGIGGMSFFDDIGFRYHLPAYMRWWLVGDAARSHSTGADVLFHLDVRSESEQSRILNAAQRHAVARFIRWMERYAEEPMARRDARRALEHLSKWCEAATE